MENEWEKEEDYYEFDIEDMKGVIIRHRELKHLCGYVGILPYHPLHGVKYNKVSDVLVDKAKKIYRTLNLPPTPDVCLDVHGGITFSEGYLPLKLSDKYKEKYWWFGFDCAHWGDMYPGMIKFGSVFSDGTYRNVEYVRGHIEILAGQLAEILKEYGGNKVDKTERSDLI